MFSFLRRLFGLKDKHKKTSQEELEPNTEESLQEEVSSTAENKTFADRYYNSSYYKSSDASLTKAIANTGNHGELLLCNELDKLDCYKRVLVNIYLQNATGYSTEVDAVCITRKAIFVLEYKNWGGTIYGKESDQNWTACYGKQRYPQYSPLLQNVGHVNAMMFNFPHIDQTRIIPLIVFSNRCKLRIESLSIPVIHRQELLSTMMQIAEGLEDAFSVREVEQMYAYLMERCKQPDQVKAAHISHVNEIKQRAKAQD